MHAEITNPLKDQIHLIKSINDLICSHPAGDKMRLMITSDELKLEDDEVLVQFVDKESNILKVKPVKVDSLCFSDILHEPHIIDLTDRQSYDFLHSDLSLSPSALPKCLIRNDLKGKKVHIYD